MGFLERAYNQAARKQARNQIGDVDVARQAAEAEKPFRDAARDKGIGKGSKVILDKVARKKGNEAIKKIDDAEKERTGFVGKAEVNGIRISVVWDEYYGCYTIYFEQSDSSKTEQQKNSDPTLFLGREPETAKPYFEQACELAKVVSGVDEIYKKMQERTKDKGFDRE